MNGIECAFIGRLGRDPELRHSQAGKPWLPLNVAVGEKEQTEWVKVAVFNTRASELAAILHKGDRVYVEGRISLDTWTDQQGQQRAGLKVAAWKVERSGTSATTSRPSPSPTASSPRGAPRPSPARPTTSARSMMLAAGACRSTT